MHALRNLLVIAIVAASIQTASAAMYLKFDGILGESTDSNHQGWSDAVNFKANFSNPITIDGRGGSPQLTQFDVAALEDKASPKLLLSMLSGTRFPKVTLDFTTNSLNSGRLIYAKWELENAHLINFNTSAGDTRAVDIYSIICEALKYKYTEIGADGMVKGTTEIDFNFLLKTPAIISTTGTVDNFEFFTGSLAGVPEPGTMTLTCGAMAVLALLGFRRRRSDILNR